MIDYVKILERRYSNRIWQLDGVDYDGLTMLDGQSKPSKKTLDELWPEIEAEIAAEIHQQTSAKSSARAKLKALGLTDAEIAALVG